MSVDNAEFKTSNNTKINFQKMTEKCSKCGEKISSPEKVWDLEKIGRLEQ
jgi:hypothetical protein